MKKVKESNPKIIILRPCGFDTHRTVREYSKILKNNEVWNSLNAVKEDKIFAVDANSFFSKPSIRTVEGIEILAKIIQPEKFSNLRVSDEAFAHIRNIQS